MKILTWNVGRPSPKNYSKIIEILNNYNADIIVLTETNQQINLEQNYQFIATKPLPNNHENIIYKNNENRTTIWTKYKITNHIETYDPYTSLNVRLETDSETISLYATIIGVLGGKNTRFLNDLKFQLIDFNNFNNENINLIIGDLNTTFAGYAYPSHEARNILNDLFDTKKMLNLTSTLNNSVNHIIASASLIKNKQIDTATFNIDKKLSDHIGICVTIH